MKRATFVKLTLSVIFAVAAMFDGGSAFAQGKVIKMIPGGDLKIIDPIQNASYISRNHGYMVYDTLFAVDSKGQVKPQMIDTWTLSPDKQKYTFTLREGLNGTTARRSLRPTASPRSSAGGRKTFPARC